MASLQLGDTLIFAPGGHLWIVISDASKHAGTCIIVNLTTDLFRAGRDCELKRGDHPWITEQSYVSYGDARMVSPKEDAQIIALMANGTITRHHHMCTPIIEKIIAAARSSKAISPGLLVYL